ncbi:stomatin-4-like [Rhodnius prolixus]|uniref:stomatin-4-like n=1 Tax=Rhodnius prolixus TaxID=13249 RepID=UPI003D18AD12
MDMKKSLKETTHRDSQDYPNPPLQAHHPNNEGQDMRHMEALCSLLAIILVIVTLPFSLLFICKIAYQYERVVILRLGRVREGGPRGPGIYLYLPCVDERMKLDLRTLVFQLDPQQVLTNDSCTLQIDVIIFCRVEDPVKTVVAVSDLRVATLNLASTILRNIIGQRDLTEILSQKDAITLALKKILDVGTFPWGVKVLRVEFNSFV